MIPLSNQFDIFDRFFNGGLKVQKFFQFNGVKSSEKFIYDI